jgi:hypothetical protein
VLAKGTNRGKANVSRSGEIAPVLYQVIEKSQDQG